MSTGGALPIILSDFYGKNINNVNDLTAKLSLSVMLRKFKLKEVQMETRLHISEQWPPEI